MTEAAAWVPQESEEEEKEEGEEEHEGAEDSLSSDEDGVCMEWVGKASEAVTDSPGFVFTTAVAKSRKGRREQVTLSRFVAFVEGREIVGTHGTVAWRTGKP